MAKAKTRTEELAAGHTMTWRAGSKHGELSITGSGNTGQVVSMLHGGCDASGMMTAAEVCPEFGEEIERFKQGETFAKVAGLRERLAHNTACLDQVGARVAELQQAVDGELDFETSESLDIEADYASQEQARLTRQRQAIEKALQAAYLAAESDLQGRLSKAGAKILEDARAAKATALDALGPAAAKPLTVLLLARARQMAAAQNSPKVETVLGPDPRKRTPAAGHEPTQVLVDVPAVGQFEMAGR